MGWLNAYEVYCPALKWVLLVPPGGRAVQVIDVSRAVTPLATNNGNAQSLGGRLDERLNRCTCMSTRPGIK